MADEVMTSPIAETISRGTKTGLGLIPQAHGGAILPGQRSDEPGRNPKGRPSAGASIKEWWNILGDRKEAEWRRIVDDVDEPGNKRVAAKRWLDGLDGDGNGRGAAIEQIISHTDGKPNQSIDLRSTIEVAIKRVVFEDAPTVMPQIEVSEAVTAKSKRRVKATP